jgi:hypothetical protein
MSSSVTFLISVSQLLIFIDVYSMIRFRRCRAAAAECRGRPYPPRCQVRGLTYRILTF